MAQPKKGARKRVPTLKPVGTTPDGSGVMLARSASARQPSFKLAIDGALVDALEEAHSARRSAARARDQLELPPPIPARIESKLSIKEVQNLLRQGRGIDAIARKAGVDPEWVRRWEGPIVWERAGTATRARRVHLRRARGGTSRVPLGEAVAANLKDRGIKMDEDSFDAAWDSTMRPRARRWVITFSFESRGRDQVARWEFDPESEELSGLDKLANELGWIPPIRRRSRA